MAKATPILPGTRSGKLVAIDEVQRTISGKKFRYIICDCECGARIEVAKPKFKAGAKSCYNCRAGRRTHGMTNTGIYTSWESMKQRCGGPGRYATVGYDPRWERFEGFLAHPPAGDWFQGAHLARAGDVGDYTPANTRWASNSENLNEMLERHKTLLPDGRFAIEVARSNGINENTFRKRLFSGWGIERAATEPTGTTRSGKKAHRLADGRIAVDVARDNGISRSTFQGRIGLGWDLERAATEPTRGKKRGSSVCRLTRVGK